MEEKRSHYSPQCLSKDSDEMKPIIIAIDCPERPVPLGAFLVEPVQYSTFK